MEQMVSFQALEFLPFSRNIIEPSITPEEGCLSGFHVSFLVGSRNTVTF